MFYDSLESLFNLTVILMGAICGAVQQYCVILKEASLPMTVDYICFECAPIKILNWCFK